MGAVAGVFFYIVGIGFAWNRIPQGWREGGNEPGGAFAAGLWPVVLTALFAISVGRRLASRAPMRQEKPKAEGPYR